jgi:hypothetical protein
MVRVLMRAAEEQLRLEGPQVRLLRKGKPRSVDVPYPSPSAASITATHSCGRC